MEMAALFDAFQFYKLHLKFIETRRKFRRVSYHTFIRSCKLQHCRTYLLHLYVFELETIHFSHGLHRYITSKGVASLVNTISYERITVLFSAMH